MPSSEVILFDMRIDRIRRDTEEIASLARALANVSVYADPWDQYNLKASVANLREAANELEKIRAKLERSQVCGAAAE
jgi:hypothetical protein